MMKAGQRTVVKLEEPHGALRVVRRADDPDRVQVFVHDCDVEEAASYSPPTAVASFTMTLDIARALKGAL